VTADSRGTIECTSYSEESALASLLH